MQRFFCLALFVAFAAAAVAQDPPAPYTNSIKMKFTLLPPGSFMMGSPNSERGRGDDEHHRKVTFAKGLYVGVTTVTQAQWQAVMGENPSHFKEKSLPVESVSWDDCQAFIKKLAAKDKKRYRLPTEAEWEYACRAGTTTPFHVGATLASDQANYNARFTFGKGQTGEARDRTMPAGSFPANAWGLHDMHGNVWQWCNDWHGGYSGKDLADPQGPKSGKTRVTRGGSWGSHPIFCRAANRNFTDPETRNEHIGFRVCFSAE